MIMKKKLQYNKKYKCDIVDKKRKLIKWMKQQIKK